LSQFSHGIAVASRPQQQQQQQQRSQRVTIMDIISRHIQLPDIALGQSISDVTPSTEDSSNNGRIFVTDARACS